MADMRLISSGRIPGLGLLACRKLQIWGALMIFGAAALAAEEGKFQYAVTSEPAGAAVFVGNSYKGRTPYRSAWVSGAPTVSYTVFLAGYRTQMLALTGIPGGTAEGRARLEPGERPNAGECNLLLELIRSELAKTELIAEVEAGFPLLGDTLTADFKKRLVRANRLIKASGRILETDFPPAFSVPPMPPDARCEWSVNELLLADDKTLSWIGAFTEYDRGEFVYGHALIYAFAKEGGRWRLADIRMIGHDFGEDEEEN